MEEEDKAEERTIANSDASTQPAKPIRPNASLHLPRHSLPEMRSLQLDTKFGRRLGITRHALCTVSEVRHIVLVSIVVQEPLVSGRV